MSHFLQSDDWAAFQKALGRTIIQRRGGGWSYLAVLEHGTGNIRLYCPYGPTIATAEALPLALNSLVKDAKAHHATFVRVEPTYHVTPETMKSLGLHEVSYQSLNPKRTQIIDLSPSQDEILAQMSQNSRNLTRNYEKKGLTIERSRKVDDVHNLTDLLKKVASRNHITPHSNAYFTTQATTLFERKCAWLYLVRYQGSVIATSLVFDDTTTRYYAHAAADDTYRKLSAGTALVGQMILDAKKDGKLFFDLYGIAQEEQHNHAWSGFTKFKQSFGGRPVDYSGSWDLPLKKLPYFSYRIYQKTRRSLR